MEPSRERDNIRCTTTPKSIKMTQIFSELWKFILKQLIILGMFNQRQIFVVRGILARYSRVIWSHFAASDLINLANISQLQWISKVWNRWLSFVTKDFSRRFPHSLLRIPLPSPVHQLVNPRVKYLGNIPSRYLIIEEEPHNRKAFHWNHRIYVSGNDIWFKIHLIQT